MEKSPWHHAGWLLLVITVVLYLPGTATIPLMDRDEPRFAHATVEMMQRETWTIPYFNGAYRFDKPPLTYWWMRLHYHLLGVNELAARLHGVLAVYLTSLVISGFAGRLTRSAEAGFFAGMAWLVSLQSLVHGRLCVADMPMILCVTLSCRALMELLADEVAPKLWSRWFWCLWLSLGAGFLAKGPIAWLVPGVALVLWRWAMWRKPLPWRRLQAGPGLVLALVMIASWGVPALIETRGAFWSAGMGEHVVKRGSDVLNGRKFVPGYYLLTTWLSLFPWLGFAMPVWRSLRAGWNAHRAFLAAWFAAPQLIFFFYATQLPHYVMPGYPGFILLLALAWQDGQESRAASIPALARWFTMLFGALVIGVWAWVHAMTGVHAGIRSLIDHALMLLAVVACLGGWSACLVWKNGFRRGSVCFAMMTALMVGGCLSQLGDALRAHSIPVRVAEQLAALPSHAGLHGCGYTEPSLVFYTGRQWHFTDDLTTARKHLQSDPSPVAVVMLRREWTLDRWFKSMLGRAPKNLPAKDHFVLTEETREVSQGLRSEVIEGFNMARFSWAEVVLWIRN